MTMTNLKSFITKETEENKKYALYTGKLYYYNLSHGYAAGLLETLGIVKGVIRGRGLEKTTINEDINAFLDKLNSIADLGMMANKTDNHEKSLDLLKELHENILVLDEEIKEYLTDKVNLLLPSSHTKEKESFRRMMQMAYYMNYSTKTTNMIKICVEVENYLNKMKLDDDSKPLFPIFLMTLDVMKEFRKVPATDDKQLCIDIMKNTYPKVKEAETELAKFLCVNE